ncbi:hypothetical protein M0208_10240 [Sphingomonas sp. SUN019]|uniref:tetratricopeptide repeat protein n=1 Tax=Sphingomonas sp. SUN019 TaxID=2937788 RepID=UPI002164C58E|nr:hypothetical protein [Sphingomonas sp. SUN019]UVO50878.1 hypothetical protein M0208_10240 [Sphingomonas sp. SUN019]
MAEERLPETPNAVDLAMKEAADDPAPDNPARILLAKQNRLIDAQVRQLGRQWWRDVIVTLLGAALLALVVLFVWNAGRSRAVVVETFDTPPSLVARGLTPQVVAGSVQDALAVIQASNTRAALARKIDTIWANDIKVDVPNTNVSIGEVDRLLRARLGKETHVGGAIVANPDGTLAMTIRATGVPPKTFTGAPAELPALTMQAAEYVYGRFEPRLYAVYLNRQGKYDATIAFLQDAYPRAPEDQRASLLNAWGLALGQKGRMREGVAKLRMAIELNPYAWGAADNLIGMMFDVAGEEGAVREGRAVAARIADAPADKRPDPTQQPLATYQSLVSDYTSLVDETLAANEANGGRSALSMGDTAYYLAEAEARRHDWRAALHYLESAEPSAEARAVRQLVVGLHAIEVGDTARAVAAFDRFDAIFRTEDTVRFAFPTGPCWRGLAYGLAGRREEADRMLAAAGRWSECYSLAGDVAEAAGDRRGADALYARAKALTPSLPLPYQRHAMTLLKRGRGADAAVEFAAANRRGPRWADPLKGWGDALAAQGKWRLAGTKYDAATPFAPRWGELAQARAAAKQRAAVASWWPFD